MILNHLKIAWRALIRQKGYSLINILGLSVSLTVCLLLIFWIWDEMKMDKFHAQGQQIYRLLCNIDGGESGIITRPSLPYPLIEYIQDNYPEVEGIAAYDPTNKKNFSIGNKLYLEDGLYANADFFNVFSFPLLSGNPENIFLDPNTVVISEELAFKLYGTEWRDIAMNASVSINGNPNFKVTGIFKNIPSESSLSFSFVINLENQFPGHESASWGQYDSRIVLKLRNASNIQSFSDKIGRVISKKIAQSRHAEVFLQPFSRMYLHGEFKNGIETGGRIEYLRLFVFAVIFLILIACINFMNLSTAQASRRAKEIAIRKTIGAGKTTLVYQFMIEAFLVTLFSVCLAVVFSHMLIPYFQGLTAKEITFDYSDYIFWLIIIGTGLVTALFAGSYPAFFLSSIQIGKALNRKSTFSFGTSEFRRGLVVFQFILSALLIVGAFVIKNQVNFIQTKNLGIDKENVLYFRTPPGASDKLKAYRNELNQIPGIQEITFTNGNPLSVGTQISDLVWERKESTGDLVFNLLIGDDNLLTTLKIPIVAGRDFSRSISTDSTSLLINETAAQYLELDDPLNVRLKFGDIAGPIVGVVKDFHIASLYESIGPLIIVNRPERTRLTMLRINPGETNEVINASNQVFNKFAEGYPFRFDFLDERFMQVYRSEQQVGKLSMWFAGVALFISCLGLLGLSAFVVEQKMKEIGIRKVLGATVFEIVGMLMRDFIKWIALALVIGLPLAWYLAAKWLASFAYQADLSWWIFIFAGGILILISILTMGILTIKSALANPILSLKE